MKNNVARKIFGLANIFPLDFKKMIVGVIKLVKRVMTKID
jgi:hypothetical protein